MYIILIKNFRNIVAVMLQCKENALLTRAEIVQRRSISEFYCVIEPELFEARPQTSNVCLLSRRLLGVFRE